MEEAQSRACAYSHHEEPAELVWTSGQDVFQKPSGKVLRAVQPGGSSWLTQQKLERYYPWAGLGMPPHLPRGAGRDN